MRKDERRSFLLVSYNREIITIWLWILFDEFIKKEEKEKNVIRVECMNILIDFLRRIHQKTKKKVSFVSIDHLFFFSVLEYFDDLTYLYDLDHWCLFTHFILRRLVLNRYYFDSNLDSMCEKKWRERFYSTFLNCLIDNHHWRTLNADSLTRLSLWNRFYH
jgi:hypothetical protein